MQVIEHVGHGCALQAELLRGFGRDPRKLGIGKLVVLQQVFFGPVRSNYFARGPARAEIQRLEYQGAAPYAQGEILGGVTSEAEDFLVGFNGGRLIVPAGAFPVSIEDSGNVYASLFNFFSSGMQYASSR